MDNDHEVFLEYYEDVKNPKNVEIALNLFETHVDLLSLNINKKRFKEFLREAIDLYSDISYHNANHALNTLNSAAYFLGLIKGYEVCPNKKLAYLIASYLHDIDHPRTVDRRNNSVELERHHVRVLKQQLNKYRDIFGSNILKNLEFLSDLVYSTNLEYHDEILENFTSKYFVKFDRTLMPKEGVGPEVSEIEFKSLIKIADLSSIYKRFDCFKKSSLSLNREVRGKCFEDSCSTLAEDLDFIRRVALPLIETFSSVFHNFKFLSENCKFNVQQLICEIKNL